MEGGRELIGVLCHQLIQSLFNGVFNPRHYFKRDVDTSAYLVLWSRSRALWVKYLRPLFSQGQVRVM
jgi:hypothetical protein